MSSKIKIKLLSTVYNKRIDKFMHPMKPIVRNEAISAKIENNMATLLFDGFYELMVCFTFSFDPIAHKSCFELPNFIVILMISFSPGVCLILLKTFQQYQTNSR
jgi:hypothetical protein